MQEIQKLIQLMKSHPDYYISERFRDVQNTEKEINDMLQKKIDLKDATGDIMELLGDQIEDFLLDFLNYKKEQSAKRSVVLFGKQTKILEKFRQNGIVRQIPSDKQKFKIADINYEKFYAFADNKNTIKDGSIFGTTSIKNLAKLAKEVNDGAALCKILGIKQLSNMISLQGDILNNRINSQKLANAINDKTKNDSALRKQIEEVMSNVAELVGKTLDDDLKSINNKKGIEFLGRALGLANYETLKDVCDSLKCLGAPIQKQMQELKEKYERLQNMSPKLSTEEFKTLKETVTDEYESFANAIPVFHAIVKKRANNFDKDTWQQTMEDYQTAKRFYRVVLNQILKVDSKKLQPLNNKLSNNKNLIDYIKEYSNSLKYLKSLNKNCNVIDLKKNIMKHKQAAGNVAACLAPYYPTTVTAPFVDYIARFNTTLTCLVPYSE